MNRKKFITVITAIYYFYSHDIKNCRSIEMFINNHDTLYCNNKIFKQNVI